MKKIYNNIKLNIKNMLYETINIDQYNIEKNKNK